jgi:hypothetical protein
MKQKIQFLLKKKPIKDLQNAPIGMTTGLYNSSCFVFNSMSEHFLTDFQIVVDANSIDREVTRFKPDVVIIEALWITPAKLIELSRIHRNVTWVIRLHSNTPFLSQEGMAFDWIADYFKIPNVIVSGNSKQMCLDLEIYRDALGIKSDNIRYLPNIYPLEFKEPKKIDTSKPYLDVGCFGAIRPLKNTIEQVMGALMYCNEHKKKLRLHVNDRIEHGEAVNNNLHKMFQQLLDTGHELILHPWRPREGFLEICRNIDIGLQVSFSETFNIVGCDIVSQGVPIVCSAEFPWVELNSVFANPTSSKNIKDAISLCINNNEDIVRSLQSNLTDYVLHSKNQWLTTFER